MNFSQLRKIALLPVSVAFLHGKNLVQRNILQWRRVKLEDELRDDFSPSGRQSGGALFPEAIFRAHVKGGKESAEKICAHEFDLLGSGLQKLGKHIDWQKPFSNEERLNEAELIKNDIKLSWELSRFQFLPTLARAYEIQQEKAELINQEKYAAAAKELIHDWILSNPLGKGTNWKITMEVAIRACNFALAWYFLKDSPPWKSEQWRRTFLTSIAEHGKFIYRNLEYGTGVTTNHFLADVTGLFFLGVLFPEFREARTWKANGLRGLEREMQKQVYEDGVSFEASIPYHRLACELFGYSALLAQTNEIWFSADFLARLEKMFEFVYYYTKPNGRAPQIGDNDDGRLFILEDFYSWERRDHRELFWLAAELFQHNPKFGLQENEKTSKGFNFSGIYIMRKNDFSCIVDSGRNGQNENGGHAHNDTLSFELAAGGEDFIIDPGAYVYTSDPGARNRFRSTAMHNTVMIDGQEMNRFIKDEVFRMRSDAVPQVNRWDSSEMRDFLDAEHGGYERLKQPVRHRRTFSFDKKNLTMEVTDYFIGNGAHELQWNFHFAPGVTLEKFGEKITAQKNGRKLEIKMPPELAKNAHIHDGEISPRYGVKEKAPVVTITHQIAAKAARRVIKEEAETHEKQSFTFLIRTIE